MRLGLLAFSPKGNLLADQLEKQMTQADFRRYQKEKQTAAQFVAEQFSQCDGLVWIGAAGIAVRLIAPHLRSKASDPAVVVLDETGRFVISLLSGHLGGANALTLQIARLLDASP